MKNQWDSFYFRLGYRIGWWYASNRNSVHRRIIDGIIYRLPGGRWLSQLLR